MAGGAICRHGAGLRAAPGAAAPLRERAARTPVACCTLCGASPNCTAFFWADGSRRLGPPQGAGCYLLQGGGGTPPLDADPGDGHVLSGRCRVGGGGGGCAEAACAADALCASPMACAEPAPQPCFPPPVPRPEVRTVHYVVMHHFDLGWDSLVGAPHTGVLPMYLNASGTFAWPDTYAPGGATARPTGLLDRSLDAIDALEAKGGSPALVLTTWSFIVWAYLECEQLAPRLGGYACPSAARRARLEAAIRAHKVTWFCNPLNSEDGLYSAASLGAAVDLSNLLRRRFGLPPCRTVGQEDDPGGVRGAIPVLANRLVLRPPEP